MSESDDINFIHFEFKTIQKKKLLTDVMGSSFASIEQ